MTAPFTPEQMDRLSAQIDQQLLAARRAGSPLTRTTRSGDTDPLARQREAISRATGEDADSFLQRFRAAARRDLCERDGVIHKQWNKWREVTNSRYRGLLRRPLSLAPPGQNR